MDYTELVKSAIVNMPQGCTVAMILEFCDAHDKSWPHLNELNTILNELASSGDLKQIHPNIYSFISGEAIYKEILVLPAQYEEAIRENHKKMIEFQKSQGFNEKDMEAAMNTYTKEWEQD